ncbi:RNA-dependent RNA polymerase family protein [Myroides odoratimimus]|uniref:Reverse transcriptase domain-containing protein n=1 Tax=Myroides odoratimimus CIP 101113 TaxID=883154 RepID=A0AAV3F723_9FLAO|nr:hypothetical protein [Myroides odoratimimus]EHO14582.1 hypothetical protein HMPREF9715_00467 [Myroides odoratimimus CIP 101113]SHM69734.1 hypothetical protein SAMN05444275_12115 [Myroides odoratimimus subsp. xuanwuensis]
MEQQWFEKEEIFLAYKKLKHYYYYDNTNILMRKKIAEFEEEVFFESNKNVETVQESVEIIKLSKQELFTRLHTRVVNCLKSIEFSESKISIVSFPKSFDDKKPDIITNDINLSDIKVKRETHFIDMDIEFHIIGVLWIMYCGRFLDESVNTYSYANRLDTNLFFENGCGNKESLKLFKPYFIQYQEWRDTAIDVAESCLDSNHDITMVSLDIKNYFHSVRINFEEHIFPFIKKCDENLDCKSKNTDCNRKEKREKLNEALKHIFIAYKKNIKQFVDVKEEDLYSLPIGFLPSGILANFYLNELDKAVIEKVNPLFYGRYVDDLIFVFKDVNNIDQCNEISKKKIIIEKLFERKGILKEKSIIQDKTKQNHDCKEGIFEYFFLNQSINCFSKEKDYSKLEIQEAKVVIHSINYKGSKALIKIFKKKIEEQRSEFRFLPDEDQISEKFDEEAFDIKYNDSINKFRSISDFAENKYGASKFLAKKIFAKSFGSKDDDKYSDDQILSFFQGEIAIKLYTLWEKVAIYFVISNRGDLLIKFTRNVLGAIKKIEKEDSENSERLQNTLKNNLKTALASALAFNPKLKLEYLSLDEKEYIFDEVNITALKLRKSNLLRHNLLSIPTINVTNLLFDENICLINNDFNYYFIDNKDISINPTLCLLLPYYIQFHEVNIFRIINVVSKLNINLQMGDETTDTFKFNKSVLVEGINNVSEKVDEKNVNEGEVRDVINSIPKDSFFWYYFINYCWKGSFKEENYKELEESFFIINEEDQNGVRINYIDIKGGNVDEFFDEKVDKKVAIANIKVHDVDMMNSVFNRPNVRKERRQSLFNLINEADKNRADLIVFPECSVPYSWIRLLGERSHKRYLAIVAGLEHWVNSKGIVFNFLVTILPFRFGDYTTSLVRIRLKNHYSHFERHQLTGYRLLIPNDIMDVKPSYDLFHFRNVYFSVYNCFELADINHRSLFKGKVDFIVASEYNKDTKYFSDVVGSWVRDIHTYFVQVNSSDFGDSRISQPSKSDFMNTIHVKGGENSVTLVGTLKIRKLRDFQLKEYHLQKECTTLLKPTPPDFNRKDVETRIQNGKLKFNKK